MRRLLVAIAVLALSVTGCTSSTEPNRTRITVRNNSSHTLDEVYFSVCASTVWGSNRLDGQVIGATNERSWDVEAGCYDIKAVSTTGASATHAALQVVAGETSTYTLTNF